MSVYCSSFCGCFQGQPESQNSLARLREDIDSGFNFIRSRGQSREFVQGLCRKATKLKTLVDITQPLSYNHIGSLSWERYKSIEKK